MKRKRKQFIAVILSGMMIFSTTGFAFADTEEETTQTEPVKIEKEVEQPITIVEQPKQEETQKEVVKEENGVQEVKKVTEENRVLEEKTTDPIVADEPQKEEEEETVNYPIKVTWHLKYRDANGEWTEFTSSTVKTLKKNTEYSQVPYSVFGNKIIKGDLKNESENKIYNFKNSYVDDKGNHYTLLSKAIAAGKDYTGSKTVTYPLTKTTDIYITAEYSEYDLVEPYEVTYNISYRDSGHNQVNGWVTKTKTISVNEKGVSNTSWSGINVAYNEMVGNQLIANKRVPYQNVYYILKTEGDDQVVWKDENNKSYSTSDVFNGSGFSQDTTVNIKAQYDIAPIYAVTVNNVDNIANGDGSWSNKVSENAACSSYTDYNYEPADIPDQYSFQYWDCDWELASQKTYKANEHFTVDILDKVQKDTDINLLATYDFQPSVKVVYHYENGSTYATQSYMQPIDIYESASVQGLDWYYNKADKNPIVKGAVAELPDVIANVTELQEDEPVVINVYAKSKEEPAAPVDSDPVTPDKPKPKPHITNTVEVIYYGMGDGEPTVKTPTFIKKNPLPLSLPQQAYWALLNLILAIATCVLAFILIIFGILNKREEDEDIKIKNKWGARIASICIGILSLIVFFITENMNNPWTWIDGWTWLMVVIFAVQIVCMFVAKHKEEEIEEQQQ